LATGRSQEGTLGEKVSGKIAQLTSLKPKSQVSKVVRKAEISICVILEDK